MTYEETLAFLYERLPMFQRQGKPALKPDLTNTLTLLDRLGNPHKHLKSVHIAGTNGKGTSAHALASILQEAGYRVGLCTSPHLKAFTERIRINGKEISQHSVVSFVKEALSTIEEIRPSFFELTVAMAFHEFYLRRVDIAVVETGLGGRLDSTNVLAPEVCLITRIARDHQDILGETLEEIASEKAGIIKPGTPVVLGARQEEIRQVFLSRAMDLNAPANTNCNSYEVELLKRGARNTIALRFMEQETVVETDVVAPYFADNLPGVLETVNELRKLDWTVSEKQVLAGLGNIVKNTGLRGRFQILRNHPLVIADISHNSDGLSVLFEHISHLPKPDLRVIYGVVRDKDLDEIAKVLPMDARYYLTQCSVPRAMPVEELSARLLKNGISGASGDNVNEALQQALNDASDEDIVVITGSTFVVAELDAL